MSPWQIVLALTIWLLLGLVFWVVLVSAGVGFLPAGVARRALARARRERDIVRSAADRRRQLRPGSVDRLRNAIPVVYTGPPDGATTRQKGTGGRCPFGVMGS